MTYPIPNEALDDRLAIVGSAGSGKTYSASGAVERVLDRKGRVIVVDPLGVWFGLRLLTDGVTPSPFNPVIFGGSHGDLPINEHAGALIGETVAGMAESCIIDLSQIGTKNGERRFMLAFLTALYRKTNSEPVHIVFDEADMFAPQKLLDKEGDAAKLLGMMETIVRRGRIKGFIPWLITQRPAVLSKDVLSQADGVIAMKLTASHDRDAIGAWIEGQADRAIGKEILASLPSKQQGEGVVWIPSRGILNQVKFPLKATFDSSRTPKRGEKKRATNLKALDLGSLREKLAAVEAETKANDPKALRAEVKRLNALLQKQAENMPAIMPDPKALEQSFRNGHHMGYQDGFIAAGRLVREGMSAAVANAMNQYRPPEPPNQEPIPQNKFKSTALPKPPVQVNQIARTNGSGDSGLKPALQTVLNAIAWWRKIGVEPVRRERACVVAGYSPKASTFGVYVAELVKQGLVEVTPGHVQLSQDGLALSQVPFGTTAEELRSVARGLLKPQEQRVFDSVYEAYPDPIARADVAEQVDLYPTASTVGVYLAGVAAYGMIEAHGPGKVRAAEWLFP